MKTFKELQEEDKIFIWSSKSYINNENAEIGHRSYFGEMISGIYSIKDIQCSKIHNTLYFRLNTVLGNNFDIGYGLNQLNIDITSSNSYKRKVWWTNNEFDVYKQDLFITTSKEKWFEKINENF